MAASASLRHEQKFERHLIGLIAGGATAGAVSAVMQAVVGRPVDALGALSFAAVVGLVINQLDPRDDTALTRLIVALIGGVLMGGIATMGFWGAPWLGGAVAGGFFGAALTVDRPQTGARKWATWAIFAAALAAAVFTADTLVAAGPIAEVELTFVRHALTGTVWGLFLAVAAGVSDLRFDDHPVAGRLDEALDTHREPVADYLASARQLYDQVLRECQRAAQQDMRHRAESIGAETVESLIRIARRWAQLDDTLSRSAGARLRRRIAGLDERLADVDDASLAREFESARDEANRQLEMRGRLELACARLESRMQRGLTTLERLHLTLVEHAANAADAVGLGQSLSQLEQLAEQVELENMSVDELCQIEVGRAQEVAKQAEPAIDSAQNEPAPDAEPTQPAKDSSGRQIQRQESIVCDPDASC